VTFTTHYGFGRIFSIAAYQAGRHEDLPLPLHGFLAILIGFGISDSILLITLIKEKEGKFD
jgi:hypothetical protein